MKKILCTDTGISALGEYDKKLLPKIIAGVDEAGRGPLAGPVVCAACIMPLDKIFVKINDSKKLNESVREQLYEIITSTALAYSVSFIDNNIIDEINILNATKRAMIHAVDMLKVRPEIVLLDAVKLDLGIESRSIIKGDATSYNIAAASIIAKVTRDRIMREYHQQYPQFNFLKNKGYGTAEHILALKGGVSPLHRQTFIKNFEVGAKLL